MAYCRWSTNNYMCDLYCYDGIDGYTTHVASSRLKEEPYPHPPHELLLSGDLNRWNEECDRHEESMGNISTEKIKLPYSDKTFIDSDLESFIKTLEMLKEIGYNFPYEIIDELKEELEHGY